MSQEVIKPGKIVSLTYSIASFDGNVLKKDDIPVSYFHEDETEQIKD
ncbi:hypothetical protein [Solemya velesiana gill symbiont]|nr:hypothetical protein [Solemya velesiana gill symbiont]